MSISINPRFITFEGIDGCGKSTQSFLLKEYLDSKNIPSIIVREPGGTTISEKIRKILLSKENSEITSRTEALLMTAARAQLTNEVIIPSLNSGSWVISDRFSDSTIAYQGGGRNLDVEWLQSLNSFATYRINPDLTFFIDIPVEILSERNIGNLDRFEEEGVEFLSKVRDAYLDNKKLDEKRIQQIDGKKEINLIHKIIKNILSEKGFL